MPVFNMVCIAPNGNRRSRPLVAESAELALQDWRTQIEIEAGGGTEGLIYEVTQANDPDGSYERALVDAERRMLEREFFKIGTRGRR